MEQISIHDDDYDPIDDDKASDVNKWCYIYREKSQGPVRAS